MSDFTEASRGLMLAGKQEQPLICLKFNAIIKEVKTNGRSRGVRTMEFYSSINLQS